MLEASARCPHCDKKLPDQDAEVCPFCNAAIKETGAAAMEARFCSACGQAVIEGAAFCPRCGAKVGQPVTAGGVSTVPISGARSGQAPKKKRGFFKTLSIGCLGLLGLFIVIGIIGSATRSGSGSATPVAAGSVSNAPAAAKPSAAKADPNAVPAKPTATPIPRVGDVVVGKNWSYQVSKTERPDSLVWSEFGNAEKAVGKWLVVYLTLKNLGRENFTINTWDFEVHDAKEIKYKTSDKFAASAFPRARKLQPLGDRVPPGVEFQSAVIFDTAPDAAGLKLWLVQEKQFVDLGQ